MTMHVANTFGARWLGWMGRRRLAPDDALWLRPCRAVHTFGMRMPIDVVFIDRDGTVLRVVASLAPWRACAQWQADSVLELPAGGAAARGLEPGGRIALPDAAPGGGGASRAARARRVALMLGAVGLLVAIGRAGPARAAAPLIDDPGAAEPPPVAIVFETEWAPDPRRLVEEAMSADNPRAPQRTPAPRWPFSGPPQDAVAQATPVRAPALVVANATLASGGAATSAAGSPAPGCAAPAPSLPPMALLRPLSPETLARAIEEADGLYHAKQWGRALEAFCGLVEVEPGHRLAWLRIGNLHHQRSRLSQAAEAYRQAARAADASDATEPTPMRARALANLAAVGLELARESLGSLRQLNLPAQASAMQWAEEMGTELRALAPEASRPAGAPRGGVEILGSRPARATDPGR